MAKKKKERFLAVYRPAQHDLVVTRLVLGSDEPDEAHFQTIASDIPAVEDVHTLIDEAVLLLHLAGWSIAHEHNWIPRTVVRMNGEDTEWAWEVKRTRPDIKIRMSSDDFEKLIVSSVDNDGDDDPRLITRIATRGRAEGILAREYLRATGWQVVEIWDDAAENPDKPWKDPGPTLLTNRPWRVTFGE